MAHTPGPWKFEHSETYPSSEYGQPPHYEPAFVIAGNQDIPVMIDDDARLISAAPELLEALKAMKRYFLRDDTLDRGPWPEGPNDRIKELFIMARDAIAKAEGNQ